MGQEQSIPGTENQSEELFRNHPKFQRSCSKRNHLGLGETSATFMSQDESLLPDHKSTISELSGASHQIPNRDIRHAPTFHDQLRLNKSSSVNPFANTKNCGSNSDTKLTDSDHVPLFPKQFPQNILQIKDNPPLLESMCFQKPSQNEGFIKVIEPMKKESGEQSPVSKGEICSSYDQGMNTLAKSSAYCAKTPKGLAKGGPRLQEQNYFIQKEKASLLINTDVTSHTNTTLNKVEKIAEALDLINIKTSNMKRKPETEPMKESFGLAETQSNMTKTQSQSLNDSSLEHCIMLMTNKESHTKEMITSLKLSLCTNLEKINNFISLLKSFPFLNADIILQAEELKANMETFPLNIMSSKLLPDNGSGERFLFKQPIEEIESYDYKTQLNLTPASTTIEVNSERLKPTDVTDNTIGKNHQAILNIIYTSCEKNYVINKQFYICIFCDFATSDEAEGINHINNDKTHNSKQISGNARYCDSCGIVLFSCEKGFQAHCKSEEHKKIMEIKSKKFIDKRNVSNPHNIEEENDNESICSSKSERSRKSPHELLLMISKGMKIKKIFNGFVGLYCKACNRYFQYNKSVVTALMHKAEHPNHKSYRIIHCSSCNIEMFGDENLWKDHVKLELHKELLNISSSNLTTENVQWHADTIGLSTERGPHYDLMIHVLKEHTYYQNDEKDHFGYYCHLCQVYFLSESQWKSHKDSKSHQYRINASECIQKNMFHICSICKIHLISDVQIFNLHQQSLQHKTVLNLLLSRSEAKDVGGDSDDDQCSVSEGSMNSSFSDSQSTTSSVQNDDIEQNVHEILITGLPPDVEKKDLFQTFKKFGFIISCKRHKSGKSGSITFRDQETVNSLLSTKNVFIKGKLVNISPLHKKNKRGGRRVNKTMLNNLVIDVLNSRDALDMLVIELKKEITEMGQQPHIKQMILQDIQAAVPDGKAHIFGSQYTGLATRNSDFDIYIDHDARSYTTELSSLQQNRILRDLLEKFTHPKSGFRVINAVLEARVPILHIIHEKTKKPCDISCRSGLAMENSMLIKKLCFCDFRVSWLVIVVKWWMRTNDLLDANKFTSYATTWLVLFFMMRMHILSPIVNMQEMCPPYKIGSWDCRFNRDYNPSGHFKSQNNYSRYKLLHEFFKFYAKFNFENVVLCPLTNSLISKTQFEPNQLSLPEPYVPYISRIRLLPEAEKLKTSSPICLQDPFDLSHNIAKGVRFNDMKKFKNFCFQSAEICEKQGYK